MTYKPRFFICCAVQILNSQRKESMQFANKLLIGSSPWFEATEKRDGDAASPQEPTKDQGPWINQGSIKDQGPRTSQAQRCFGCDSSRWFLLRGGGLITDQWSLTNVILKLKMMLALISLLLHKYYHNCTKIFSLSSNLQLWHMLSVDCSKNTTMGALEKASLSTITL